MVKKQEEVQQDDHHVPIKPIKPEFNVFSRKQMRKEKKQQKKQFHMQVNQKRHLKNQGIVIETQVQQKPVQVKQPKVKKEISEEEQRKLELQKEIEKEDQEIERLTKKLKLKSNRLSKAQLKEDGFEDDLFDFLDHIDQSIKVTPQNYNNYKEGEANLEDDDIEVESENNPEDDDIDEEQQENEDEQDEYEDDEENEDIEQEEEQEDINEDSEEINEEENDDDDDDVDDDEIEPISEEEKPEEIEVVNEEPPQKIEQKIQQITYDEEKLSEIRKLLNRNLNKLSEANINNIVEEINKIFESHPKQIVGLVFAQQLVQSTIRPKAILPYLLTCITAASCYFHQVYDNLFFGELIKQIILKIKQAPEVHEMKNVTLIFCHWYLFESISLQFVKEYIQYLIKSPTADNIENINTLIQYCGKKIRSDNPAILKQIIDEIKEAFTHIEDSRTRYLLMMLDDLRMNKKISSQSERLEFIINWHKQKTQKMLHRVFCQGFNFSMQSEFLNNNWWKPIITNEAQTQLYQEFKEQKKNVKLMQLEQLAVEQKMVTETRKTAFVIIMGADDLFEATQNLDKMGYLKKKKQDVALVVVEMCGNENTYNPYYVELAHHLINFERGLKQSFQYMLWDKFKLLEHYTIRKQTNIAKFAATLLKKLSLNLLLLKWFNYDVLPEVHTSFLSILLKHYLQGITIDTMAKQCKNLFEHEDYLPFRSGLQTFLKNQFKGFIGDDKQLISDLRIMIKLLNEDVSSGQ